MPADATASPSEPLPEAGDHLPLTPVVFEILLSVVGEERHGYAILRDVEARTGGRLTLHAGTLYRALGRLVDDGLLEETDGPDVAEDQRRRYYRITALGVRVARAEKDRLERQVAAARGLLEGAEPA